MAFSSLMLVPETGCHLFPIDRACTVLLLIATCAHLFIVVTCNMVLCYSMLSHVTWCTAIHCCHMVHCYSSLSHGALLFIAVTWSSHGLTSSIFGCYVQVFVLNLLHLWVVELEKVVMADTFTQLSVIYVT